MISVSCWQVDIKSSYTELFRQADDTGRTNLPDEVSLKFGTNDTYFPSEIHTQVPMIKLSKTMVKKLKLCQKCWPTTAYLIIQNQGHFPGGVPWWMY